MFARTIVSTLFSILLLFTLGCSEPASNEVNASEVNKNLVSEVKNAVETTSPVLTDEQSPSSIDDIEYLTVNVIERRNHNEDAFSQGFEFNGGKLYESHGLYGKSGISEINPNDGNLIRWLPLGNEFFGEGLTIVGDYLLQLTWRNGIVNIIDIDSFEIVNVFSYEGEGWGLCFDGEFLYMSNGSNSLTVRDPSSFVIVKEIPVRNNGNPVQAINELECVGDIIYANIWQTDTILKIDNESGNVLATIDASGLLTSDESASADVLNGIAYNHDSETFLITGKLWPAMFEVTFGKSS